MNTQMAAVHPYIAVHIYAFEQDLDTTPWRGHELEALSVPTLAADTEPSSNATLGFGIEWPDDWRLGVRRWCREILDTPVMRHIDRTPAAIVEVGELEAIARAAIKAPAQIERLSTTDLRKP